MSSTRIETLTDNAFAVSERLDRIEKNLFLVGIGVICLTLTLMAMTGTNGRT